MKAEKFTLSNNLEVIYLKIPESQKFRLFLSVPVGALHDPAGKAGMSHILEHMAFCGTSSMDEKTLLGKIRAAGGHYRAFTGYDTTTYDLNASTQNSDNFYVIADIMRKIISEPLFDEARLEIEKKVIINERADTIDNVQRYSQILLDKAMHHGQQEHPSILGSEASINSVTGEDLKEFINANYNAAHMSLYAAGPLDQGDVVDVLEQTLSGLPHSESKKKPRYEMNCQHKDIRQTRGDLLQNNAVFMFVLPSAKSPVEKLAQFEAAHHLSSLLPETLRSKYGCFYSPKFGNWDFNKETVMMSFTMSSRPHDCESVCLGISEFYHEVDILLSDEIIQGILDSNKFYFSRPEQFDPGILYLPKIYHEEFSDVFDLEEHRRALNSVSVQDVREKTKQILESLTGIYVQGPDPDKVLSLDAMRALMVRADRVENVPSMQYPKLAFNKI